MESYDVLVIILSVALAISLIVWITVGVLVVRVLKRLQAVTDSAQHAADNVQEFTEQLKSAGKMSMATNTFSQIAKLFRGKGK